MSYRPFYDFGGQHPPATVATLATVEAPDGPTVAVVATVARALARTGSPSVGDQAELEFAYQERAAILEYDEGLPRWDAERLAREQTGYAGD